MCTIYESAVGLTAVDDCGRCDCVESEQYGKHEIDISLTGNEVCSVCGEDLG